MGVQEAADVPPLHNLLQTVLRRLLVLPLAHLHGDLRGSEEGLQLYICLCMVGFTIPHDYSWTYLLFDLAEDQRR